MTLEKSTRLPWFPLCFGLFLGLALLKFGNPPIMEKWVAAPTDIYELVLGSPWPIAWAYGLAVVTVVGGVVVSRRELRGPRWLVALPLAWLCWQCVAAFGSVNPELSTPTVAHFAVCVICFYVGCFSLAGFRPVAWLLPGLLLGFLIVLAVGWEQHFGGLDQTRQYFFIYIYPRLKEIPPEYFKKISSTRIFSTLFYPNALAGAILLLLPVLLQFIWNARARFSPAARAFLAGAVGIGALGCLYWSGSKGGWLLMLVLGLIWLLRLPFRRLFKIVLITAMLLGGLAGFFWKYSSFFQKGATSVSARFDYWEAALRTTLAHPVAGTGPGTFSLAYQKVKRPESEMARLAHNDYLEQASDSGLPGFVLYSACIIGLLVFSWPKPEKRAPLFAGQPQTRGSERRDHLGDAAGGLSIATTSEQQLLFALWLGVLGWALQGLMEFGLYIPGLAWPAFAFMGLLLGRCGHGKPKAEGL